MPLTPEDTVPQFVDFASPPKWHLAHTTWFFEEMILGKYLPGYRVFDELFGALFNSYYLAIGSPYARNQRGVITRPGLEEVMAYRRHVDHHMGTLLEELPEQAEELVTLGLNHEQQHQELLITDLKIAFAQNPMYPVYDQGFDEGFAANSTGSEWLKLDAGEYQIGASGADFCFDNETKQHSVLLQEYEIASQLVTCGEYLEFVESGGYQQFEYWLDEGWSWVQLNEVSAPMYWHRTATQWQHFTLAGLQPLPLNSPVCHLSYYEANAYAAWRELRLPTEFEWEAAASSLNWGQRWEWTASSYQPYPGFAIGAGAVGEYNGKFMVNQMVLRGASVATAPGHSRESYRNFFHPQHQWQYSGIRLAK